MMHACRVRQSIKSSHSFRGVSPRRCPDTHTTPRSPTCETLGSHESRASKVDSRRTLQPLFVVAASFCATQAHAATRSVRTADDGLELRHWLGIAFGCWLVWKLLRGAWWRWFRPLRRDVSRLRTGDGDPGAAVEEIVDTKGGPLKPLHRRLALRDGRLLPTRVKDRRRKLRPDDEAMRLFSPSQRTQNRTARDLLADEEQLMRHGLPVWKTEAALAAALGVTVRQLWYFACHRLRDTSPHYVTFAIPKRRGGERLIMAPKRFLKALQRRLNELLVNHLPVSEAAHGFRKGRSIRTNAEPHVGQGIVVRVDLADFFPTVTYARVRGYLIAIGYSYPVAASLALLLTEAERQPVEVDGTTFHVPVGQRHCVQGAPTSPGLCNAIFLKADHRIAGLARKFGFNYTRYADDLTFSGSANHDAARAMVQHLGRLLTEEGFTVNTAKTSIQTRRGRQSVTGVVVNDTAGLSRQERRRLRAMAHRLRHTDTPDPADVAHLEGKLNYLAMLNPAQAAALRSPMLPEDA